MASFNNFTKALGGLAGDIKAKAADAASEALHVKNRVTQHALEAAGIADKTMEDEDIPELMCACVLPPSRLPPGATTLAAGTTVGLTIP